MERHSFQVLLMTVDPQKTTVIVILNPKVYFNYTKKQSL